MNRISLIYTYYNYPSRMKERMDLCNRYSDFVKKNLDIIIIDDGSEIPAHTLNVDFPENVYIYRVPKDTIWNEKGARNLGIVVAQTQWVIFTDFDHWFEESDIERMIRMEKDPRVAYRFSRRKADNSVHHKPLHKESFLIHRLCALQAGGFSECFTGLYGGAPYVIFYEEFEKLGGQFKVLKDVYIYHRGNKEPNAFRDGDKTNIKDYDETHGILHFRWERTL